MKQPALPDHADRWFLLGFLVLALVLRLPGHLDSGLWFDEIWLLVETVRRPFPDFYTTFASDNNHPFYSLLGWLSVRVFGESAWTLRLPALVFGVASIGMLWVFARASTSRAEALVVTGLMTVSYHHVWFSQNARGYTMLLFWTLAATHYLVQVLDGRGRRSFVAYAVCLALATYTHSSAVAVAIAHAVVSGAVVMKRQSRARLATPWYPLGGLLLAGVLSLLLHATILDDMVEVLLLSRGVEEGGAIAGSEWNSPWWTVRAVAESLNLGLGPGLAVLAAAFVLMGVGTLEYFNRDWRLTGLFVLPALFGLAMTLGLGRPLRPRFFFNLGGFILMIVVAGVFASCRMAANLWSQEGTRQRVTVGMRGLASVGMFVASLAILPRAYLLPKQDFEGALEWARTVPTQDDAVVVTGLTVLPYRDYFGTDFAEVSTVEELEAQRARSSSVFVLHTLPIYVEAEMPELAAVLSSGRDVARFPGSLGAGDIVVLQFPGRGAPPVR